MPVRLSANVQDRLIYAARNRLLNPQNQAVLEFKGRLNENRLAQAVRISIEAEPILGSRFIEKKHHPYWQRFTDLDSIEWFSLEEARVKQKAINRFLTTPLNNEHEQQVKAKLIRSRENDTLCIKISHACCDGGGLKAYQQILAGIYTQLSNDQDYDLGLNMGGRKDQNYLFRKLGIVNLIKAWEPQHAPLQPTWALPFNTCKPEEQLIAIRRLPGKYVEVLSIYAHKRGASMNDLILTAFYRALFKMLEPPPGKPREILITVDLRRYLRDAKANVINNLSSAVSARIARVPGESFEKTLARVSAETTQIKRKLPGVHVAVLFGFLSLLSYEQNLNFVCGIKKWLMQTGKCSPVLSNVGSISQSTIWFDKIPVVDAYQVSPAIYAPGFMLGVCKYNNYLTFTVSYYKPSTPQDKVEQFLDIMLQDLCNAIT
ncbi:condensation domain-containing protein [Desulfoscipio gibsoniae]|uniref:Uncharacterized protein containing a NRPS condensation (Elongation) domain n=1 Tax=Desulfoscipio gibsoniae DSM 7213 TaxID=767817 RepID=R4KID1_9FIRM|nr:condensation domain-containing protein [Desulfoscipio gibsoniae]AGL02374.1 uncharacterized protein containing a NRPS condensation (elongation) domain [Desulfoscipio gibsoniae DSM 7213]